MYLVRNPWKISGENSYIKYGIHNSSGKEKVFQGK